MSQQFDRVATIDRWSSEGCRWPMGEPCDPGFRFCCAETGDAIGSYCPEHHARAYRKADEKTEGPHAIKPQRPGTFVLVPTVPPMRGLAR